MRECGNEVVLGGGELLKLLAPQPMRLRQRRRPLQLQPHVPSVRVERVAKQLAAEQRKSNAQRLGGPPQLGPCRQSGEAERGESHSIYLLLHSTLTW